MTEKSISFWIFDLIVYVYQPVKGREDMKIYVFVLIILKELVKKEQKPQNILNWLKIMQKGN